MTLVTNLNPLFKIFELFNFFVFYDYVESKDMFLGDIHSDIYHMHANMGPQWPEGFPRHRRRGRGDDIIGVDAPKHSHKLRMLDT